MVGSWTATSQRKNNNFTCCKCSKLITSFWCAVYKGEGGGDSAAGVGRSGEESSRVREPVDRGMCRVGR